WDQVGDRVLAQVGDRIWAQVVGLIQNVCFDQHEKNRLAAYEFLLRECGLTVCEELIPFMHIAEHCGWWLPYSEVAIVSERPIRLHQITNGDLHCDGGPAVAYRDGWAGWFLNGVRVPQEIAETPGDQLDPQLVLTERNAEIRREIVRKVGAERLCEALDARVVDAWGDYELLELDLRDNRRRPYLKMKNPSIGVYHIEGVPPVCRTVQEALIWRNGTDERPVVLT
ncbi:MAG: hypothetical protein O7G87_02900, partial [bacterium]|nr:hypothetical protein [bacterium]